MVAFADRTRLVLASEEGWGIAPSGAFTPLPLIAESLRPELAHIRPQFLNTTTQAAPILSETSVSGDIEGLASTALLRLLLPYILMAQGVKWHSTTANSTTDENGRLGLSGALPSHLQHDDFIWLEPPQALQVPAGFYPIVKNDEGAYIGRLPKNSRSADSSTIAHHMIEAGEGLNSFSMMRNFGTSVQWAEFTGMCMQRLILDASEGSLMTVTASLIGRAMSVNKSAPTITPPTITEAAALTPLELAQNPLSFGIGTVDGSETLTPSSLILTGFRLVLERVGMAAHHALGSTRPRLINQGRLSVYGSFEVIVSTERLFAWLTRQDTVSIAIILNDGEGGVAVAIRSLKLTGVENLPRGDEAPITARFDFTAEADGAGEAIRFFLYYPNLMEGE